MENKTLKIKLAIGIVLLAIVASVLIATKSPPKENITQEEMTVKCVGNLTDNDFIICVTRGNVGIGDGLTDAQRDELEKTERRDTEEWRFIDSYIKNDMVTSLWQNKSNESEYIELIGLHAPRKLLVVPTTNTSENTSIAKPINFSLGREYVEAMLKQQNPNKTISFKEIWCDATLTYYDPTTTENDGSCYVTYSLGEWNYTVVAVDKQYKDDWW